VDQHVQLIPTAQVNYVIATQAQVTVTALEDVLTSKQTPLTAELAELPAHQETLALLAFALLQQAHQQAAQKLCAVQAVLIRHQMLITVVFAMVNALLIQIVQVDNVFVTQDLVFVMELV